MRLTKVPAVLAVVLVGVALLAPPASANMRVTTVDHVDDTFVDSEICPFDITFHVFGSLKFANFYDSSGFLYKTIGRAGPGRFTVTITAGGTTLTQQNSSFTEITTYNADGSVRTLTDNGPFNKFTAPGSGIVWLDTGHLVVDGDFNVLFVAGPRQNGEFEALCDAFSQAPRAPAVDQVTWRVFHHVEDQAKIGGLSPSAPTNERRASRATPKLLLDLTKRRAGEFLAESNRTPRR